MKLARLAIVLSVTTLTVPAAHAAQPTIDEKIAAIIEMVVPPNQLLSGPFPDVLMLGPIEGIAESYQSAAQSRVREILLTEMDEVKNEQRHQLAAVLSSVFSSEEIEALFAFLSSPAGRSIVGKRQMFGEKLSAALASSQTSNYAILQKTIAADPEIQRLRQLSQTGK